MFHIFIPSESLYLLNIFCLKNNKSDYYPDYLSFQQLNSSIQKGFYNVIFGTRSKIDVSYISVLCVVSLSDENDIEYVCRYLHKNLHISKNSEIITLGCISRSKNNLNLNFSAFNHYDLLDFDFDVNILKNDKNYKNTTNLDKLILKDSSYNFVWYFSVCDVLKTDLSDLSLCDVAKDLIQTTTAFYHFVQHNPSPDIATSNSNILPSPLHKLNSAASIVDRFSSSFFSGFFSSFSFYSFPFKLYLDRLHIIQLSVSNILFDVKECNKISCKKNIFLFLFVDYFFGVLLFFFFKINFNFNFVFYIASIFTGYVPSLPSVSLSGLHETLLFDKSFSCNFAVDDFILFLSMHKCLAAFLFVIACSSTLMLSLCLDLMNCLFFFIKFEVRLIKCILQCLYSTFVDCFLMLFGIKKNYTLKNRIDQSPFDSYRLLLGAVVLISSVMASIALTKNIMLIVVNWLLLCLNYFVYYFLHQFFMAVTNSILLASYYLKNSTQHHAFHQKLRTKLDESNILPEYKWTIKKIDNTSNNVSSNNKLNNIINSNSITIFEVRKEFNTQIINLFLFYFRKYLMSNFFDCFFQLFYSMFAEGKLCMKTDEYTSNKHQKKCLSTYVDNLNDKLFHVTSKYQSNSSKFDSLHEIRIDFNDVIMKNDKKL